MRYSVSIGQNLFDVELKSNGNGWLCRLNGREIAIDFTQISSGVASLLVDGKPFQVNWLPDGSIFIGARRYEATVEDLRAWKGRRRETAHAGPQRLTASMPGKIVRLLAREGEEIQVGQGIVVVEAMKMQNEIRSPRAGKLQKLMVREGASVNAGEVLAIVE